MAHRTGVIESKDLERVVVDTTVQEKAIAHPTDARLTDGAIEKLVETAKREGVELRRVISAWRNARPLWWGAIRMPTSSSALGGNSNSCARDWPHHPRRSPQDRGRCRTAGSLWSAARSCMRVRHQEQRQRGPKVY